MFHRELCLSSKNVTNRTKNVREQNLFQIEQKKLQKKRKMLAMAL